MNIEEVTKGILFSHPVVNQITFGLDRVNLELEFAGNSSREILVQDNDGDFYFGRVSYDSANNLYVFRGENGSSGIALTSCDIREIWIREN